MMASDLNRDVLRESGLLVGDATEAGPNDLVSRCAQSTTQRRKAALDGAVALLSSRRSPSAGSDALAVTQPRSLRAAHRAAEGANLAVISVPGQFAAGEARQALADGLHVFLFSDNVADRGRNRPQTAGRAAGLAGHGPGLRHGHSERRRASASRTPSAAGLIGLIGASGTGLQEVTHAGAPGGRVA